MSSLHVWYAFPLDVSDGELQTQLNVLSKDEKRRCAAFRFETHRHHYLAAHVLLRRAISNWTTCRPEEIQFARTSDGKPYCIPMNAGKQIEFSLTHTHGLVACAVSSVPVGIDAEWIGRKVDFDLLREALSEEERIQLEGCDPASQHRRFLEYWTLKEAYLKAIGKGLSVNLKSVSFDVANGNGILVGPVTDRESHKEDEWRFILHSNQFKKHVLAIAIQKQQLSHVDEVFQAMDLLS